MRRRPQHGDAKDKPMPASQYTISIECIDCGACENMCPRSAIVEAKRQFVIRRSLCNGCGICAGYCPTRAIFKRS